VVTINHPMKSCDLFSTNPSNDILDSGWCGRFCRTSACTGYDNVVSIIHVCNPSQSTFQTTYGVWGGFAPLRATLRNSSFCISGVCVDEFSINPLNTFTPQDPNSDTQKFHLRIRALYDTTDIICR